MLEAATALSGRMSQCRYKYPSCSLTARTRCFLVAAVMAVFELSLVVEAALRSVLGGIVDGIFVGMAVEQ